MQEKLEKIKQQTPEQQVKIVSDMVEWLKARNIEYYENDAPTVADSQYDSILNLLKLVEKELPHLKREDSPTQYVGGKVNELFTKVEHNKPMLSLDNAFNKEDVENFLEKFDKDTTFTVQHKFDGMALSLHYKDGELIKAVTRGDGTTGEDVTLNAREIENVPLKTGNTFTGEIRGEVVMKIPEFNRLNTIRKIKGEKLLANPRNAAAGTMRQKDISVVQERKLTFFPYDIVDFKGETAEDMRNVLINELGIYSMPFAPSVPNDVDEIMKAIEKVNDFRNYHEDMEDTNFEPYEIDGAVIKLDAYSKRDEYGTTSKFPNWAIAFKFPAEEKETVLKDIQPTIGRTGKVTYNAVFEPINIAGSMISAASLHNAQYIKELGIGIGDKVIVKKAGEIIPQVVRVSEKLAEKDFEQTTHCPHCKQPLSLKDGKIDQFCLSSPAQCKGKLIESLSHFVSRDGMNIDGFSKQTIVTLHSNGLLNNFADIFKLDWEKILTLEGFQEKSINNLKEAIEKARVETELHKLIFAIGIENIGKKTAKDFVKWLAKYGNVLDIIKGVTPVEISDIELFSEFGTVKGEAVGKLLKGLPMLFRAVPVEPIWEPNTIKESKITGLKTVVTGTIEGGKRDEIKDLLEEYGAKVVGSVSKATQFIFAGKKASESKLKKAINAEIVRVEHIDEIENFLKK